LGCHRKHSSIRIPHRLPNIAAATLATAGAAFCMAPQAMADPAAPTSARQAVVADAASRLGPAPEQLLSVIEQAMQAAQAAQATQNKPHSGQASWYTVRSGDSFSSIAERAYHNENAWPVLYWANRSQIPWADALHAGQVLRIPVEPAKIPDPPALLGPTPAPEPAAQTAAPAPTPEDATAQSTAEASYPGGSFAQCVIARESGGQPQVMNSSGHYGLYQFSASTWAEYGGSPADFGDASVAEQNQVFANAIAAGGESNWSPYDGC
jgi:LysM repeat protein